MDLASLTLALLALLLTPGPTNTLMFLAGTEGGWPRIARLIPVEVAAYLAVILPLALLLHGTDGPMARLQPVVAIAAGVWVLHLPIRLWRPEASPQAGRVTAARIALTTAMNPKGLVMGLVLLPAAGATPGSFAALVASIAAVALIWGGMGAMLPRAGAAAPGIGLLRRAASVWLAGLSAMLVLGGIGAGIGGA